MTTTVAAPAPTPDREANHPASRARTYFLIGLAVLFSLAAVRVLTGVHEVDSQGSFVRLDQGIFFKRGGTFQSKIIEGERQGGEVFEEGQTSRREAQLAPDAALSPLAYLCGYETGKNIRQEEQQQDKRTSSYTGDL